MDELTIRELLPEQDLPAWLDLVNAINLEKTGSEPATQDSLRRMLNWPGMRCWVAAIPEARETLSAYGLLFPQIPERSAVEVAVHPAWRSKGLGRRLLAFLIERARESGAECVFNEIEDSNPGGIAFLERYGFRPAGDVWVLQAGVEADFDDPNWPEGYSVRSFAEVGNMDVLIQACNRGFGDMWGHHENTAGGVTADDLKRWMKNWDLHGVFITFAPDGSPIGSCRAQPGESEDLVDEPGVAPEHRHHRLQRPMVLTALEWLRSQGRRPVRLESWGDTPETVALYQGIGFELAEHAVSMKYDI